MTSYKNRYLELMLTMKKAVALLQKVEVGTEGEFADLTDEAVVDLLTKEEVEDEMIRPKLVIDKFVIGNNIRVMRQRHSLTIEELAKELKISTAYLGLIERGERNVTLRKLCMLSNIFHAPLEDFIRKGNDK